jgi:molybdenum cofactor biosynthesis enzyme MoaA
MYSKYYRSAARARARAQAKETHTHTHTHTHVEPKFVTLLVQCVAPVQTTFSSTCHKQRATSPVCTVMFPAVLYGSKLDKYVATCGLVETAR